MTGRAVLPERTAVSGAVELTGLRVPVYGLARWDGPSAVAECRLDASGVASVVVTHGDAARGAVVETERLPSGEWPDALGEAASRTAATRALGYLVQAGRLDGADVAREVDGIVERSVAPGWPVRLVEVDGAPTPLPVWLQGPTTATVVLLPDAVVTVGACGVDLLAVGLAALDPATLSRASAAPAAAPAAPSPNRAPAAPTPTPAPSAPPPTR